MKRLTKKQLDRALLKLFKEDRALIPRCVFPNNLYDYAWRLWAKTKEGRAELRKAGR